MYFLDLSSPSQSGLKRKRPGEPGHPLASDHRPCKKAVRREQEAIMPCHVPVASLSSRRRRKKLPSALRQMRLLTRLCKRGLNIAPSCAPAQPSGERDGQGKR